MKLAKIAVVVLAESEPHESLGRLVNGLVTAKECQENGDDVRLVFDGGGTQGLAAVARPDHQAHKLYTDVRDVISGACSYCAAAFGVKEKLLEFDIPLLDEYAQHPSLRSLIVDGYQVVTF